MMRRDPFKLVNECLEAHAFYTGRRKYKDNYTDELIAEAYLMRSETLAEREG